jgi:hypothetical protein
MTLIAEDLLLLLLDDESGKAVLDDTRLSRVLAGARSWLNWRWMNASRQPPRATRPRATRPRAAASSSATASQAAISCSTGRIRTECQQTDETGEGG